MDAEQASAHLEWELMILARQREQARMQLGPGDERLDRSAYVLLSRLEVQGPMSIADFVDAFGLAASTFNRQTAALLRDGLVERTLDPNGGVARKFRITVEGTQRLTSDRRRLVDGLTLVLADWSPERLERFVADFQQFNEGIEHLTGRPWPRPAAATTSPLTGR
ncbi:MarR family winged helix-turn-helix transcriptional regulator [Streptomyces sp. NPDC057539]|uniref:MarR family winged helix-turn-helix transcriptional regulator n=1 Tax=Streptomyces sp. NPDC057539 TaxID=3346159 RepID=UPI003693F72C